MKISEIDVRDNLIVEFLLVAEIDGNGLTPKMNGNVKLFRAKFVWNKETSKSDKALFSRKKKYIKGNFS